MGAAAGQRQHRARPHGCGPSAGDHDGSEHDEHSDNDERPSAAEAEAEAEAEAAGGVRRLAGRGAERERGLRAAGAEQAAGHHVGFALVTADGQTVGELGASDPNYGASITKAMLLVAYLAQHPDTLDGSARSELTAMIENSDNAAADWVYAHLRSPADELTAVAQAAGMTGFQIDTSDPVYVLGQSQITAGDFADLFARIDQLLPPAQRAFALSLLANVSPRSGLLAAGLPGVVYAKEGWKPEPSGMLGAPYVVNQAAQFHLHGVTYGVAVTVGGVSDETEGEAVVQRVVAALMH